MMMMMMMIRMGYRSLLSCLTRSQAVAVRVAVAASPMRFVGWALDVHTRQMAFGAGTS
jgi:hypothetical protein